MSDVAFSKFSCFNVTLMLINQLFA